MTDDTPDDPVQTPAPSDDRRAEVRRVGRAAGAVRQRVPAPDPSSDLVDGIVQFLARHRPDLADAVREIEPELRQEFGGAEQYVRALPASAKVRQVMSAFNGRNASEVARELGISRATVYRRIKQVGGGSK